MEALSWGWGSIESVVQLLDHNIRLYPKVWRKSMPADPWKRWLICFIAVSKVWRTFHDCALRGSAVTVNGSVQSSSGSMVERRIFRIMPDSPCSSRFKKSIVTYCKNFARPLILILI